MMSDTAEAVATKGSGAQPTAHGGDSAKAAAAETNSAQSQQEKEKMLADLHAKVSVVYEQCGFDASSKPSTLFMMSQLESKLEVLLQEIEKMPPEYVIKAEKEKEKRRREKKREEQQALQELQQEERNRRAVERSLRLQKEKHAQQHTSLSADAVASPLDSCDVARTTQAA